MKRTLLPIVAVALLAGPAFAQPIPQTVAPAPYTAYGDYSSGSTVAGSAMTGMANVMSARGSYNLQTSEAAINMTQAQSAQISNHQQYESAYFQMRAENTAAREQQHPRPTEEQLVQAAREAAPRPLSASAVNPVNGQIAWPTLLQYPHFTAQRAEVEKLLKGSAAQGGLGYAAQAQLISAIDQMAADLDKGIGKVPPQQFEESRSFLKSLIYSTCHVGLE